MHGRPGGPPTRGTGPGRVVRGGSRRPESNAVGRHLRLMGRSGPLDGTASSEGGYADQVSLGFLTNVSRASNPAGPIAADAGMLAVPTRHLRRRPGSRPRPQRHPLTLAVRRLPAGTGWMSRFGQVGSPASVYPRGHVQGEDLALVDHLVERREPARDGGRRTRRRRRVRGRAGLLPCRLRRAERRGDVGQVEDREEDAEALDDAGAQLRVDGEPGGSTSASTSAIFRSIRSGSTVER